MTSLWTQLFKRPRHNAYARLDADGKCLAFKQCSQAPRGLTNAAIKTTNGDISARDIAIISPRL